MEYGKPQSGAKAEAEAGKDCGNREKADVAGDHSVPRDGRGCHPQVEWRDSWGLPLCARWAGSPRWLGEEEQHVHRHLGVEGQRYLYLEMPVKTLQLESTPFPSVYIPFP